MKDYNTFLELKEEAGESPAGGDDVLLVDDESAQAHRIGVLRDILSSKRQANSKSCSTCGPNDPVIACAIGVGEGVYGGTCVGLNEGLGLSDLPSNGLPIFDGESAVGKCVGPDPDSLCHHLAELVPVEQAKAPGAGFVPGEPGLEIGRKALHTRRRPSL